MKIRMIQQMSGLRADREPWPGPGAEFEVGDDEGASLIAQGIAVAVKVAHRADDKAETRPAPEDDVETRDEPEPEPAKPRVTGPRGPAKAVKG